LKEKGKGVYVVSLGCPKNLVDTEHMMGLLAARGYEFVSSPEEANIALINTCGFLTDAVEEAIEVILEVARYKKEERGVERLIVAGCMVQRYGYKLRRELPEVDAWLGVGQIERVVDCLETCGVFYLDSPLYIPDHRLPRVRTTPYYTAYLRISDGCSHGCTFCLIPKLRGNQRSRSLPSLMEEARNLVSEGVKELNIVAQDTTAYGKDLDEGYGLEDLLEELVKIRGLEWIRILYANPSGISERLLRLIEECDPLCPYLDIPFQHVSSRILEHMGRKGEMIRPQEMVEKIRGLKRDIAIRTTFMVGFPGEEEKDFQELVGFVKWARLEHVGVFVYSKEAGTRAARYTEQVPHDVALRRKRELMALQADISRGLNRQRVGNTYQVLLEGYHEETHLLLEGRTSWLAPDVDGRVLINKGNGIIGDMVKVKITEAHTYDLIGEIIS